MWDNRTMSILLNKKCMGCIKLTLRQALICKLTILIYIYIVTNRDFTCEIPRISPVAIAPWAMKMISLKTISTNKMSLHRPRNKCIYKWHAS